MISKSSSECSISQEEFSFSVDGKTGISDSAARIAKSRASNNIIASIMNVRIHEKQALALHCALSRHRLFKQATSYGFF